MCLRSGEKAPGRLQELRGSYFPPSLKAFRAILGAFPFDTERVAKTLLVEMDDFSQPGERFTLPLLSKRLEKPRLCGRVDGEGETLS